MLAADLLMSEERFQELPDDVQRLLTRAARESVKLERRLYAESDNRLLAELERNGVEVSYPDPAPFREAAAEVYERFVTTESERELLEAIRQ